MIQRVTALAQAVAADIKALYADKVDKEVGKGLSDRNFTQAEKDKLADIVSVTTKSVQTNQNIDPINAIDLGVSVPALVSPNEKAGVYVRDTKSALFSGKNNVEVREDYVQMTASSDEEESLFALKPDDATFLFMRGEEYEEYSLKEMFGKIGDVESALIIINGEP